MALNTFDAAKAAADARGWTLSNLELQKLLYIAHMIHLGRNNAPLVRELFEAWDFGPVLPSLYHRVKMFGKDPVKDVFYSSSFDPSSPEVQTIRDVANFLSTKPAAELVAITHWQNGAWAKHYQKGLRNLVIPNADIRQEYQDRMRGPS